MNHRAETLHRRSVCEVRQDEIDWDECPPHGSSVRCPVYHPCNSRLQTRLRSSLKETRVRMGFSLLSDMHIHPPQSIFPSNSAYLSVFFDDETSPRLGFKQAITTVLHS
jgi:hypothetical protein